MRDALLEALADEMRRDILLSLYEGGEDTALSVPDDLVIGPATSSEEAALYHKHLPKLEACDVVVWNRETGVLTRGDAFDTITPLLELTDRQRQSIE